MRQRLVMVLRLGLCGMALIPTGCEDEKLAQPQAPPPAEANGVHLNHALPRLRTLKLYVGPEEITAEVALTVTEMATGMMFRESMGENEGMLFVFRIPHRARFYMKNTKVPLSAAYIDPEGNVLEIRDLKPLDENPVEANSDQVQFVLEMNQGWFERHHITEGAYLRTEKGTLAETFLPGR